jgi:hypothetical protein
MASNIPDKSERIRLFTEKLREKRLSDNQCQQAAHAISLYFEMQSLERQTVKPADEPNSEPYQIAEREKVPQLFNEKFAPSAPCTSFKPRQSQYLVAGYQEKSSSPEWDEIIDKLADEIKVRHYSRKTLKTYAHWSRQFQRFLKNKSPQELSTADVKEYPPFAGQLRYPHHPDAAWPFQPEDNHDLHPLCAGHDDKKAEKPAGLLNTNNHYKTSIELFPTYQPE